MKTRTQNEDRRWLVCLLLFFVTASLYLPSLSHGFLDYDDQEYVSENRHVAAALTRHGLVWAFGFHAGNWHPFTWLSHMLDCQIFGLHAWGHHLTSVLIHSATTAILFLVLQRLTGAIWRSAAVAALFGWHPLHVESVAWVAERKDVLSAFFFVCAIGAYARWAQESNVQPPSSEALWRSGSRKSKVEDAETRDGRAETKDQPPSVLNSQAIGKEMGWYGLALLFFALGLMSKPMVVTLPFVLLLLDWWPLARSAEYQSRAVWLRLAAEKIPFFILSALSCVLTVLAQAKVHAIVSKTGLPIGERVSHAILAYAHYLRAIFLPFKLAAYYPYESGISGARVFLTAIALAAISAAAFRFRKHMPYLFVGWLWFLGMLVPVIGMVQVGDQAWADRYAYLPSIGIFISAIWGIAEVVGQKIQNSNLLRQKHHGGQEPQGNFNPQGSSLPLRAAFAIVTGLVAVALLIGTTVQLSYWKNTRTLFEHTTKVTRNNHMAITLLGSLMAKDGKVEDAIRNYQTALRIKPGYPEAHFFMGTAFDQQGKTQEAIQEYRQVLWYKPVEIQAHILLGADLAKQKNDQEAATQYQAALKLDPSSAVAHNNLARLLHTEGRLDDAIAHYKAALKYDSSLAQAHNNLGTLLLQKGILSEGTSELREALRLNPGNPETGYNLAVALNQQGKWSEAAPLFALIAPKFAGDPKAHYQFGLALQHQQKTREAMGEFASALLVQPDFPDALAALSWILATSKNPDFRNGQESIRMAERACELTARKDARKLKVLAAAYAEAGRFKEAVVEAEAARMLGSQSGDDHLAMECRLMSESFSAGKPWREDF